MAQRIPRQLIIKTATLSGLFLVGILAGKLIFGPPLIPVSPTVASVGGQNITVDDVQGKMTPEELNGNSPEYQKQLATSLLRSKVLADLAAKDGLSEADFIKKIEAGADDKVTDDEVEDFIKERSLNKKKMTKSQHDNIVANMKEHKRAIFFNEYLNKVMASIKTDWKSLNVQ